MHDLTSKVNKELSRFSSKRLNEMQKQVMTIMNREVRSLAEKIINGIPDCEDRKAALRCLRLVGMQVNSAISHEWPNAEDCFEDVK